MRHVDVIKRALDIFCRNDLVARLQRSEKDVFAGQPTVLTQVLSATHLCCLVREQCRAQADRAGHVQASMGTVEGLPQAR